MRSQQSYQARIIKYYTNSNWLYKNVWAFGGSRGLHFGLAESDTQSHTEALINQYRFMIKAGKINSRSRVLDAGCGVGGATVYIAKQTGARVLGISLVPKQIEDARGHAKREGVEEQASFMIGDYTKTGLESESFDVVFGMESVCYAWPQSAFLREAYRVLKPGGRLILSDGYRKREVANNEKAIMSRFCQGWRLATLADHRDTIKDMRKVGFKQIIEEDVTAKTELSLERMRKLCWLWRVVGEPLVGWMKIGIVESARDNALAMQAWTEGVRRGLFGYFTQVAYKL